MIHLKKPYKLYLCIPLLFLCFLSACKTPINGWLDGQWEVMNVSPVPQVEIIDQRLFYNFNLHVCDLTYYGGMFSAANLQYDGETLSLQFPYATSENSILTLRQYGILSNPVVFNVEFKDKHNLILFNEESTVVLKKH